MINLPEAGTQASLLWSDTYFLVGIFPTFNPSPSFSACCAHECKKTKTYTSGPLHHHSILRYMARKKVHMRGENGGCNGTAPPQWMKLNIRNIYGYDEGRYAATNELRKVYSSFVT